MAQRGCGGHMGFWHELQTIARRGGQVWTLVPARRRWALAGGVLVMVLGSAASTAIPLYLGKLVDSVNPQASHGLGPDAVRSVAIFYLVMIGGGYLVRECLNVLR